MQKYGGHYKMNGAPVNVPATLDHVLDVLPRMPNQLQLHPVKLKRQIQYKSHYMYDMVHRDKIIGAISWLKQHNTHYACIHVNADWLSPTDICAYHKSTENSESESNKVVPVHMTVSQVPKKHIQ